MAHLFYFIEGQQVIPILFPCLVIFFLSMKINFLGIKMNFLGMKIFVE